MGIPISGTLQAVIYIPIWLDLLSTYIPAPSFNDCYLHSNMVRFIIQTELAICSEKEQIYIPIWLDLLFCIYCKVHFCKRYLHSNMVRFIIDDREVAFLKVSRFTFQYG